MTNDDTLVFDFDTYGVTVNNINGSGQLTAAFGYLSNDAFSGSILADEDSTATYSVTAAKGNAYGFIFSNANQTALGNLNNAKITLDDTTIDVKNSDGLSSGFVVGHLKNSSTIRLGEIKSESTTSAATPIISAEGFVAGDVEANSTINIGNITVEGKTYSGATGFKVLSIANGASVTLEEVSATGAGNADGVSVGKNIDSTNKTAAGLAGTLSVGAISVTSTNGSSIGFSFDNEADGVVTIDGTVTFKGNISVESKSSKDWMGGMAVGIYLGRIVGLSDISTTDLASAKTGSIVIDGNIAAKSVNSYAIGIHAGQLEELDVSTVISAEINDTTNGTAYGILTRGFVSANDSNNPQADSKININKGAAIFAKAGNTTRATSSITMGSRGNDVVNIGKEDEAWGSTEAWTNNDGTEDKAFTLFGVEKLNVYHDTTLVAGSKRGSATTAATVDTVTNVDTGKTLSVDDTFFNGGIQKKTGTGTITVASVTNTNPVTDVGTLKKLDIAEGIFELIGSSEKGATLVFETATSDEDTIKVGNGATLQTKGDVGLVNVAQATEYAKGDSVDLNTIYASPLGMTVDGGTVKVTNEPNLIAPGLFVYVGENGATIDISKGDQQSANAVVGDIKYATGQQDTALNVNKKGDGQLEIKYGLDLENGTINVNEGTLKFNNALASPAKIKHIVVDGKDIDANKPVLDLAAGSVVIVTDTTSQDTVTIKNGATLLLSGQGGGIVTAEQAQKFANPPDEGLDQELYELTGHVNVTVDGGTIEIADGVTVESASGMFVYIGENGATLNVGENGKAGVGDIKTATDVTTAPNLTKTGTGNFEIKYGVDLSYDDNYGTITASEGKLTLDPHLDVTNATENRNIKANIELKGSAQLVVGHYNQSSATKALTIGSLGGSSDTTTTFYASSSLTITKDSDYAGTFTGNTGNGQLFIGNADNPTEVTLTHATPFSATTIPVNIAENSKLALDRKDYSSNYTFNQNLTGSGTLEVGLKEATNEFTLGSVGDAFTGTVNLTEGTIELNGSQLQNATLNLNAKNAKVTAAASVKKLNSSAGSSVTINDAGLSVAKGLVAGTITGDEGLTKNGDANDTLTLSGDNSYEGATTISAGTLALSEAGRIDQSSGVTLSTNEAIFDVSNVTGSAPVVQNLQGSNGTVNLGEKELEVKAGSFAGVISGTTNGKLTKTTDEDLSLSGTNSYTGETKINAGTLALEGSGSIEASSGVNFTGAGTFDISGLTGTETTIKTLSGNGTVELGQKYLNITGTESIYSGQFKATGSSGTNAAKLVVGDGTEAATITLNHATPFVDAAYLNVEIATDAKLVLDRKNQSGNYEFNQKLLAGTGTLEVELDNIDTKFSFGNNVESAFTGTVSLTTGTIELDGSTNNNAAALTAATLQLAADSIADVKSNTTIKNLTTNGGTVKFTDAANEISPDIALTVTDLNVKGGLTLDLAPSISANINTTSLGLNHQNFFDYDADTANFQKQLIVATNDIDGTTANVKLSTTNSNEATKTRTINNGIKDVGTATFDYNASVIDDGSGDENGVYLGYGLTEINADNGETVELNATGSTTNSLYAKLTGEGGFEFTGANGQTVTVGNSGSSYTGATEVTGTNFTVNAATNNAFGNTSNLNVEEGATVNFNDKSQTVKGLTGEGTITNGDLTVNTTTDESTFNGTLTGTTALTKTGNNKLTLTKNNNYKGATTISDGTLALTGDGSIAESSEVAVERDATLNVATNATVQNLTGDGSVEIVGSKTLSVDKGDFSGNLKGAGTLTKTGTGKTLTLSGANEEFTGETQINEGILKLTGDSIANSSKVAVESGATLNVAADATVQNLTGNGSVKIDDLTTLSVTEGTFNGIIDGDGSLTKTGNKKLTLTKNNTYKGATTINAGGTLALTGDGSIAESSKVDVTGTFDIEGVNSASVKNLQGSGSVTLGNATLSVDEGDFSGNLKGTGTLTKTGIATNTLILSGTNTEFTGKTQINTGTLVLSGSIDNTSGINVADNATLNVQGTKTLNNLASTGMVTFDSDLTLAGESNTAINGLDGAAKVTKTGNGTTTLGNNTVGTFVQEKGEVVLTGDLTGNYTQENTAGKFTADTNSGTATITGNAEFNANVELESRLNVTGNLELGDNSTLNVDFTQFNNPTNAIIDVDGSATIDGNAILNIKDWTPGTPPHTYTLLSATDVSGTFDAQNVTFDDKAANNRQGYKVASPSNLIRNLTTFTQNRNVTYSGGSDWSTSQWDNSDTTEFYDGDYVTFSGTGQTLNVDKPVVTAGINVSGGNWMFNGQKITATPQFGDGAATLSPDENNGTLTVTGSSTNATFNNELNVEKIIVTDNAKLNLLGNETVTTGTLITNSETILGIQAKENKIVASGNIVLDGDIKFVYEGNQNKNDTVENVVITTGGTISGDYIDKISDKKLLSSTDAQLVNNNQLNVVHTASSVDEFATHNGLSGNTARIGSLIDKLSYEKSPLLQQLYGLEEGEQEKFEQILFEQLGPELAADAMQLSLWQPYTRVFNRLHDTGNIYSNNFRGQCYTKLNYELWFEGYYRSENVSRDAFANGYKTTRGGLLTGIESRLEQSVRAGFFFGYGNPRVSNNIGRIEADDITFGAYSRLQLGQELFLNSFLAYGSQNYKYRHNNAHTSYNGDAFYASIELFRNTFRQNGLQLIPLIAIDFQKAWTDGFSTPDTAQKIDKSTLDQTVLRIGLNSKFQPTELFNFRTRLQYGVQLGGDLYGSARTAFTANPTESRVLTGVNLGRNMFNVGIGTDIYSSNSKRLKLFADYDLDLGERSTAHTGQLGFVTTW